MKNIYFLLLILSLFQARAQSWCTPGSTWHYSTIPGTNGYTKYTYLYDTLVGTNLCNKIKREGHGSSMAGYVFDFADYIYTFEQNGIVFKNNGTLNAPQYDTLYNFVGVVGTKWRSNPSSGQACAQSYIEITGSGSLTVQGQTLNYKIINYTNYFYHNPTMSPPQTGIDTLFERIGTRHQMEFISGYNCADITDAGPVSFRCFSDNQISIQSSTMACNYVTGIHTITNTGEQIIFNNPATDVLFIKSGSEQRIQSIEVFDQLGKKVKQITSDEVEIQMNVEDLPSGVYSLQLKYANTLISRKLAIQK